MSRLPVHAPAACAAVLFLLPWLANAATPPLQAGRGAPASRIVGGATTTTWPAVVIVLRLDVNQQCTGFVVDQRWVLTTASCMSGAEASAVVVGFGSDFTGPSADWVLFAVERVVVHPAWDPGDFIPLDSALLRLDGRSPAAPLNVDIGPRGTADVGRRGTVVGFGRNNAAQSGSAFLKRQGTMQVDSVDGDMLIAEGATPNVCYGDTGGPFVATTPSPGAVIAMSEVAIGPACDVASGFTRMDRIGAWLAATVRLCAPGQECTNLMRGGFEEESAEN